MQQRGNQVQVRPITFLTVVKVPFFPHYLDGQERTETEFFKMQYAQSSRPWDEPRLHLIMEAQGYIVFRSFMSVLKGAHFNLWVNSLSLLALPEHRGSDGTQPGVPARRRGMDAADQYEAVIMHLINWSCCFVSVLEAVLREWEQQHAVLHL